MLKKIDAILSGAENRETFFYRVKQTYPTLDGRYKMIERAYNTAKDAFREKYRDDGERYFEHLRAVALIQMDYLFITDHLIIVDGLLHDLKEDIKSWNLQRIQAEFGMQIAEDLEWLSKPSPSEFSTGEKCLQVYHNRFNVAPRRIFLTKLPDRFHNVRTLWSCTEKKRLRKIEETEMIYLPIARRELILAHELEAALEELKNGCKS